MSQSPPDDFPSDSSGVSHSSPSSDQAGAGNEPGNTSRWSFLGGYLVLLIFACLGPLGVWWVRPPRALPAAAPKDEFSALRAAEDLTWIAKEPHPSGSERLGLVRDELVGELQRLGLGVQLQEGSGSSWREGRDVPLVNILARLPGRGDGTRAPGVTPKDNQSLLLLAHYDSVPGAPGAGDDGAGVAAILETLRALGGRAPGVHDLLVLISDGEEEGLLGAKLFVEKKHPWLREVGAVLNFEGRGAGGPSNLFQVGPRSSGLLELYSESVEHPFGTSLAPAIFKRMPNDTDFTVFMQAGKPGLNFAFVGGGAAYHTAGDNLAALDLGSLQQHGEVMLALVRALGDRAPGDLKRPHEQEFLFLTGLRWVYPQALTLPLVMALALGCLAFLLLRGAGPGAQLRAGVLRTLLGAIGALVIVTAAGALVYTGAVGLYAATDWCAKSFGLKPEFQAGSNLLAGEWLSMGAWILGLGCALFGVSVLGRGRRADLARRRLDALAAGALLLLAIAAAALALWVPGAGNLGLLILSGSLLCLWWTGPRRRRQSAVRDDGDSSSQRQGLIPQTRQAGGFGSIFALLGWGPAALALLPLAVLFVQLGSVDPFQERLLAACVTGLALLSAMPFLAAVGARREKLALFFLLAGSMAMVVYAACDLALRVG